MSWTYDSSMPTPKDKVRFLIQDTVTTNQLLQDEEINFMLVDYPNYKMAAANCADVLSSKFSGMADERKIGNLTLKNSDRSKKYADLANRLRMQASKFILPYAGGISQSDKQTTEDDTDRVKPFAKRGAMDQKLPEIDGTDD